MANIKIYYDSVLTQYSQTMTIKPVYPYLTVFVLLVLFQYQSFAQNVPNGSTIPTASPVSAPTAYTTAAGNYVRTYDINMITTDPSAVIATSNTANQVKQTTTYVDGLGRPLQTVVKNASPSGYDFVSPFVYDAYGLQQYQYLPYIHTSSSDGSFKLDPFNAQKAFYQNTTLNPGLQGEQVYYAETQYEPSPLNRVQKTFASGNSWASTGGNHPAQLQYLTNTTTDAVRIWTMPATGNIPVSTSTYAPGTLYKNITTDEQGHLSIEFKNNDGHVVLKKVSLTSTADGHTGWLCTYYVCDDLENLRFVIAPKAVNLISSNWVISQAVADGLCFQYTYDGRNRMVTKKLPDAGIVNMVYDTRDRQVFLQDANLLATQQWLVTFYDALNRPVMTALYPSTQTAAQLQATLNSATPATTTLTNTFPGLPDLVLGARTVGQTLYEASQSITFQDGFTSETGAEFTAQITPSLQGNTEQVTVVNPLPGITGYQPLTYTFYDDYTYNGAKSLQAGDFSKLQADPANSTYATPVSTNSTMTKGLVTGNKVRVLGTDQWLTTTTYYDAKGRPVQMVSDNLQGGQIVNSSLYDFTGKVLSTYEHVTNPRSGISPDQQVLSVQAYDDNGRLVKVSKQVNGGTMRVIAQHTYDELGRLKKKTLDNNLEVVNNEYNIKGWLSAINKDYVAGINTEVNHFGEKISYNTGFSIPQYNGNISGITWKGFNTPIARAYGYGYDAVNRITSGDFRQQNDGSTNYTNDKVDFTVSGLTYDENGNILTMNQNGLKAGQPSAVDQLHYKITDNSNKLQYVWDGISDPTSTLGDFHEPAANKTANQNSGTADYGFDGNGNLVTDQNKAISATTYNHLNLPQLVTITGKGTIQFVYDAAGAKLRKIVTDNTVNPSQVITTDYLAGTVYQNDTLQFISHEEGRIRFLLKTGQAPQYVFDYFLKDHLGDVREVLTTKSDTAVYAATMETGNSAVENALFSNIDNTRTALPTGYPADNTTNPNAYTAKLNAQSGQKTGPSLVLRVMAGDVITIGTKAYYTNTGTTTRYATAADMITSLLQAFASGGQADGAHVATGASSPMTVTTMTSSVFDQIKQTPGSEDNTNKPKAYLNFVLFDDQFNMVPANSGNRQVQASPGTLQTLTVSPMTVKSTGFIYIYLSNESAQDVYFDNLVVNHTSGPLLEETHYYPFGLTMAGISSHALGKQENRYKYNGKELQSSEFSDGSGLDEYDYGARFYDQQIGKWGVIDPKVEKYNMISPYSYAMNDPILYVDPNGMDNVVYLQVLKSAQLSKKDINGIIKQANANFKQLGLKTQVKLFKGTEINMSKIDETDAVAVLGAKKDVISTVSKLDATFGNELQGSKTFGSETNPEHSENDGKSGNIIAIDASAAKKAAKDFNTSATEATAFFINHGAGHNTGMDHSDDDGSSLPSISVMSSGQRIYNFTNQGTPFNNVHNPSITKLSDFINTSNNQGAIKQAYITRFGNNTPIAKIPVE